MWVELNNEQDELKRALGSECVSITGSQQSAEKEILFQKWMDGHARILLSKLSIFGFGLNLQCASHMAFVSVGDSWEKYYQGLRRIYRFGQKRSCIVHVVASELEGNILANLKRKEADAMAMAEELSAETRDMVRAEVRGSVRETNEYRAREIRVPEWMGRREADYE